MNASDGIATVSLIVAALSLYVSLRQNRNNEQLRVIERRQELIGCYQRCADVARRCRLNIERALSLSPPEVQATFESEFRDHWEKLLAHEKKYDGYPGTIRELRFGEQYEPHWRRVQLENLFQEFRLIAEGLERDIEVYDKLVDNLEKSARQYYEALAHRQYKLTG